MTQLSQLTINPHGCRIEQLTLGGKSILWSGTRPDGKPASTHPCLPNFGQVTEGTLVDLPQHGPARNTTWQTQTDGEYTYEWSMPAFRDLYPTGLHVERRFTLTNSSLILTQTHTNYGDKTLPINPGEHLYFPCPVNKRSKIKINRHSIPEKHWSGTGTPFPMSDPTSDGEHSNSLSLPSLGIIKLTTTGYFQFKLWSQPHAPFVCIEPIMGLENNIYLDHHRLFPQQTSIFTLTLKV